MATLLIIAQILGMLISIPSWITKIMELIDLIRRLPKAEQIGAARELKLHVKAIKQAKKGGRVSVVDGAVFKSIDLFETALKARLKDI